MSARVYPCGLLGIVAFGRPQGLCLPNEQHYIRTLSQRTTGGFYPHFLYARVSDVCQTIDHQRSHAEAAGFKIDEVRAGDQVVVRWVDRLGRSYDDATGTIRHLMAEGVVVKTVINMMVFDGSTTDPIQKAVRDAMIAFMAATAQAQAEATKAAQRAGIAHAKAQSERKYKGRKPSYTRKQFEIVRAMLDQHQGVSAISKATALSRQTIYRIEQDPAAADAVLATWGG
jgi:putative DNA-invertase from lambdoid prophage Rac